MANKYFRNHFIASDSDEEIIYTVPDANTAIASSLRVTNKSDANRVISVYVYPLGEATAVYVLESHLLPIGSTIDVFSGVPLVMQASDELAVVSSGDETHFYLSYLELDRT